LKEVIAAEAKVEALETEYRGLAEGMEESETENEKLKRSATTGEENVSVCEKYVASTNTGSKS
jgi:hypothetical protein